MPGARGSTRLARREFLGMALGSAAALATQGRLARAMEALARDVAPVRHPLYLPPTLGPSALSLAASPAIVDVGGGQLSPVLAYNGLFPGPTIRARKGDGVSIRLTNGLSDVTTVHWHGMVVPTSADGHPRDAVAPGNSYTYEFPVVQRACMNWYHPHPHMLTPEQVAYGLAGAFVVTDDVEAALGLPSGSHEVPLVIRDADFDSRGDLVYKPRSSGYLGKVPLVNGTRDPKLEVDTALYRLRILNGANGRVFRLVLASGAPFTLVGNDGGLLASSAQVPGIMLGSGERLDLLVDFRGATVGDRVMLRCAKARWNLLEFVVARRVDVPGSIPTTLSTIRKLSNPVVTREFSFDGMSRINGREYDIDRIDFHVPFGQTELWRFTTGGNAPHPVHVHGASFQVKSRSGGRGRVFPWERGWKDTVLLLDGETVDVLIRFDRYRGLYLMHCHKLEHEDMGMMTNFEVV